MPFHKVFLFFSCSCTLFAFIVYQQTSLNSCRDVLLIYFYLPLLLVLFLCTQEMSTEEDNSTFIPSIRALYDRYIFILEECDEWNKKKPILGLYRYTNSLEAEKQFLEKVSLGKLMHVSVNMIYYC